MNTKELLEALEAEGLTARNLDELVHSEYSEVASDLNNGGLDDQVHFLVTSRGLDPEAILQAARDDKAEFDEGEEQLYVEQLKDEKRGLYPDKQDIAN